MDLLNYPVDQMSSDQLPVAVRRNNKLVLDSSEEERIEAREKLIEDQNRAKKQQKRKRKIEQAKLAEQEAVEVREKEKKYQTEAFMFQEDSNSRNSFTRVEKKIRKAYPEMLRRKEEESGKKRKRQVSSSSEEQSCSESESQEIKKKQTKAERKVEKRQEKKAVTPKQKVQKKKKIVVEDDSSEHAKQVRRDRVKIESQDPKDSLVQQLVTRWFYCLPEWPPRDYPYQLELRKSGYRLVETSKFKFEEDVVDNLQKVIPSEGYLGVFKSKTKLVDVRPKNTCPSIRFFKGKEIGQLTNLLRQALSEQIRQLKRLQPMDANEEELLAELERQLMSLN